MPVLERRIGLIMLEQNDIVTITLSKAAVNLVFHHVKEKERTVRAGGAYWTALSSEHKSKRERQITGYLGECALYVYWHGIKEGLKRFDEYRTWYNQHPNKNDGGADFLGMDVKTRRVIKDGEFQNWNKAPINQDLLNFEIIVRPRSTHLEDHRYMLIIVEYDNAILEGNEGNAVVYLIGWAYQKDTTHFPKGQRQIRGEHYAIAGNKLQNMDTLLDESLFNDNTLSFYERMQQQENELIATGKTKSKRSRKSDPKPEEFENTGEVSEANVFESIVRDGGFTESDFREFADSLASPN